MLFIISLTGKLIVFNTTTATQFQLNIRKNDCNSEKSMHKIELQISATSPAIFVYIQLNHKEVLRYDLSKNGFMQATPVETVTVTFNNPSCSSSVTADDFSILTVNSFMPNVRREASMNEF